MAKRHWLKDRALRIQGDTLKRAYPDITAIPDTFSVLLRYQTTNERAFARAKKQLEDVQKARREFVSQELSAPQQSTLSHPQDSSRRIVFAKKRRKIRPHIAYSRSDNEAQETVSTAQRQNVPVEKIVTSLESHYTSKEGL